MTAITIQDIESSNTHTTHNVAIDGDAIHTTVTHSPSVVRQFISNILHVHRFRLNRLVVGLDIEWRPTFGRSPRKPVATLQICIGRRCLIYQLLYTPSIPQALLDFLSNPTYCFVGVGVDGDAEMLRRDYQLRVAKVADLRPLAAKYSQNPQLKNAGLKVLASQVLGMEIQKSKKTTLSKWDAKDLTSDQIAYACIDAFVSFEIGRRLI
ncbi:exodeoxyribonuclease I [Ranunculus cassubicifolius]